MMNYTRKENIKEHGKQVSGTNPCRDKNTRRFLPICPTFGGQSYLVPIVDGRRKISRETNRGARNLAQTPRLPKK